MTDDKTKGVRRRDAHATGKAQRLRPYEQKNESDVRRRINRQTEADGKAQWPEFFEFDGRKYKNEGILSDSSGEAIILTVSCAGKKFALKLYYYDPDHRPNHAVLEKIKHLGGSGLLVNIVSHGEWSNPLMPGHKNDYELMDFCEGGSLDGTVLGGDEKALAEVAVRMASAIDFLAKHGILHRDIKPSNFFYADKAKTQIVLADFGISMECPQGGTVKIDEMRSPVYAAPEFYTNVPGEPAEVGVESDFFSLGVALLCLWMGKDKLTANESQLLRSKLNETLPMPKDMSPHMASLIKALTRLKMSDRATFDDIKRWVKGENLDASVPAVADSGFRVVFNSAKNQIANSPAELAQFLVDDATLGKKYIYSGRVTRWLEETGRNEIAVNVEEITEELYPSDQEAGLWAVAYMLDPSMDYIAPDGKHFTDPAEIAVYIFDHSNELGDEVLQSDSRLMIYLHAHKMDKTIAALRTYIEDDEFENEDKNLDRHLASYYLAVLLDPDVPLPVSVGDGWEYVENVDELLAIFHKEGDIDRINRSLLMSHAFIVWLSYRRPELAGKIRMLHDNVDDDDRTSPYYYANAPYRIAFELDPAVGFNFSTDPNDPNRQYTIPQIGEYLNERLNNMVLGIEDAKDFMFLFNDMDSHPVGQYLRARGENYMTFLSWARFCMDVDNDDNTQKAGPYDLVIGAYKTIAGFLGHAPTYPLRGKLLKSTDDLADVRPQDIGDNVRKMPAGDEKPVPWLDAWLTVFYQENPALDLSKPFTYEKATALYTERIAQLAPANYYAARYTEAINEIDDSAKQMQKSGKSVKRSRNLFLLLGGIPSLIMILSAFIFGFPERNPIGSHIWPTLAICIVGMMVYRSILWGFVDSLLSLWPYIAGAVVTGLIYIAFALNSDFTALALPIVLVTYMLYYGFNLFKNSKSGKKGDEITGTEFEYRQLDALYYAYRQTDNVLDNAVTQQSEAKQSMDKASHSNISYEGWRWVTIVWMLFVIWYFVTPQISGNSSWISEDIRTENVAGKWVLGKWDTKYAGGSTRIVCNIDSVHKGKDIFGTMVIAGQAPVQARGSVFSQNDTLPESFNFYPISGGAMKQCLNVEYSTFNKEFNATYTDRKGISHQITVLSTPMGKSKSSAPAQTSKPQAKPKTKAKAAKVETQNNDSKPAETSQEEEPQTTGLWKDTM